ncbi:ABC transporter permease [Kaistia dalseonensis]|uniref:ABC transport system permease protein n=1 Tax=Kaistia dalseonensis TaxID=410840 RepID=A0ABU0H378_9HYPH|nr:ABC transporter permease [Kaistia dalseonensis]MCX5494163.1 ABC transporter permease [Kaistia dalseonensis]MDQ0436742.1 putative ABC transport system permease protein [Kaistia dalseonensis]
MLQETLKLALKAIRRNPLRSFLTVLGIVIGVAAVIAMVTIGNGTTAKVTSEISKLGSNMLFMRPGQFGPGRASTTAKSFNARDVAAIETQIAGLRAIAPISQASETVIFGGESRSSSVVGTTGDYLTALDWGLASGRSFLESEERGRAACIIGETVRSKLFGSTDAIGQSLRVGKISCSIIGVLEKKGQSGMGTDQDDIVLMPLRTFQRRIAGNTDIGTIVLSAQNGVSTSKIQANVQRLMRERRNIANGKEDDFSVNDMTQMLQAMTTTTTLLTGLLGAVAAVSLLVGGIGIMNIMLVSVTERTREIGIRLAIGALESQVLLQFLVEAVVLSVFGGIVGVLLGLGLAYSAVSYLNVPFVTSLPIIALAFGFSAMIGMVFGYFPARRAASLDPIEALRRE